LARWQADHVGAALRTAHPGLVVEQQIIVTTGDRTTQGPLWQAGGKGVWVKEIEAALLDGTIDLAVHSLKDVPAEVAPGLILACIPARADVRDAVVSRNHVPLALLPAKARVGTSSARRRAQVLAARPDAEVLEARGNIDTRIRRLDEERWDAIVLARAGLARLGRLDEVAEVLPFSTMLPAIGQGALAIVAREDDSAVRDRVSRLDDLVSHREVRAERALLDLLEAGCRAPVAGLARVEGDRLRLAGAVFAPDGSRTLREEAEGPAEDPEKLGREVAERLLARGAASLIALARG
jgi:hydroxymethylbilane synthase